MCIHVHVKNEGGGKAQCPCCTYSTNQPPACLVCRTPLLRPFTVNMSTKKVPAADVRGR